MTLFVCTLSRVPKDDVIQTDSIDKINPIEFNMPSYLPRDIIKPNNKGKSWQGLSDWWGHVSDLWEL
ncbi:hypothetical protein SNEBB_003897 [Seison nebaliae]|nr:hypothetical protein SNEBB_003897 [Seison nebaliae]